jgi:hypothetical protein
MGRKRKPRAECLLCGKPVKRFGKKFCSRSCANTYRIIPFLERRQHKECENCGKKFSDKPAIIIRRKYCSRKCAERSSIKKHNFVCCKCGEQKTQDDFYVDRHKARGHVARCKQCYAETAKTIGSRKPSRREASFKSGAQRRGLPYNLTHEQFMSLWQQPCHYCGEPIDTIGIDRVDNTAGYMVDNVVPCCRICNSMKSHMNLLDFLVQCNRISSRALGRIGGTNHLSGGRCGLGEKTVEAPPVEDRPAGVRVEATHSK